MKESTDLTDDQIFKVFGMFDVDDSVSGLASVTRERSDDGKTKTRSHCHSHTANASFFSFPFSLEQKGDLEFDEFYLLACMLVAIKDGVEKEFLFRHSRTCFELLDEGGLSSVGCRWWRLVGGVGVGGLVGSPVLLISHLTIDRSLSPRCLCFVRRVADHFLGRV